LLLHLITLNDTHSVGLLWTKDLFVAETSALQHTTLTRERDIHDSGGIRARSSPKRAATDTRLRPRSQRDRTVLLLSIYLGVLDNKC